MYILNIHEQPYYMCIQGLLLALNGLNIMHTYIFCDTLPSPGLNPLKGPTMLSCKKVGLEGRSRFPALKRGRGAC